MFWFIAWSVAASSCRPRPKASATGQPRSAAVQPAPQSAAPAAEALDFAVIGDFGQDGPGEAAVAALVASWTPDFIVTTGDNNYPNGEARTFEANIAKHYAPYIAFGAGYTGPSKSRSILQGPTKFFPALGNHDWRVPGARDHLALFQLPGNGRYFVVNKGPIDLFFVDSDRHEPDGTTPGSKQGQWLKAALAQSTARAKIVVFHHPPYTVGPHSDAEYMRWPFAAWGASMILCGHNHNYERHTVDGIPYVVNGIGGARLHDLGSACPIAESSRDVCYSPGFGAMRMRTVRAPDASRDQLLVEGMDTTHAIFDRFVLPL